MKTSELITIPKQNNMGALRLLFALIVVFVHSYDLSQQPALMFISHYFNRDIAVQGFFVLSGFLIFMSYENSPTLKGYFIKRIRRIYPAYFTVIVICAVAGGFLTTIPLANYLHGALHYLGTNLVFMNFLHPDLPGVFATNYMRAVNGALWTIKIEVLFYAAVPLIAWVIHRYGKFAVLIGLYLLSFGYNTYCYHMATVTGNSKYLALAVQLPGQLMYFMAGAMFYYFFDVCRARLGKILLGAALAYPFAAMPHLHMLQPLLLAGIVVGASFIYFAGNAGRYGDMSYGVYILHFPIIQTLICMGAFRTSPIGSLCCAIAMALGLAFLSWHFVEKPFLSRRSHYVQVEHRAQS